MLCIFYNSQIMIHSIYYVGRTVKDDIVFIIFNPSILTFQKKGVHNLLLCVVIHILSILNNSMNPLIQVEPHVLLYLSDSKPLCSLVLPLVKKSIFRTVYMFPGLHYMAKQNISAACHLHWIQG